MATSRRNLSRRAILRGMGIAPLALVSRPVGARGAAGGSIVPAILGAHEPNSTDLEYVAEKAKNDDSGLDKEKYKRVVTVLWSYFVAGAGGHGKAIEPQLLRHAYHYLGTGSRIASHLDEWDNAGHEPATNVCAYKCGHFATDIVESNPGFSQINQAVFNMAWHMTKADVSRRLERARTILASRKLSGRGGITNVDAPSEGTSGRIGFGCT